MKNSFSKLLKLTVSVMLIASFLLLSLFFLDAEIILGEMKDLASRPFLLLMIFFSYFLAFLARGLAWKLYLKNRASLKTTMYGLFYSLLLNHLLPVKAGDLARIGILKARESRIPADEAIHSVIVLRLLDTAFLFTMAIIGLAFLDLPITLVPLLWIGAGGITLVFILLMIFRKFFIKHLYLLKNALSGWQGLWILGLTLLSWVLEAAVIYGVVLNGNSHIQFIQAVWVNSITVAGQIFQITPGGIASYEAVMVFALGVSGIGVEKAYSAAIITHGLKYIFTFIVGGAVFAVYPVPLHLLKKWTRERGNET
jgi:glycosyltransferase AglD